MPPQHVRRGSPVEPTTAVRRAIPAPPSHSTRSRRRMGPGQVALAVLAYGVVYPVAGVCLIWFLVTVLAER
jgi:hypothetical protein